MSYFFIFRTSLIWMIHIYRKRKCYLKASHTIGNKFNSSFHMYILFIIHTNFLSFFSGCLVVRIQAIVHVDIVTLEDDGNDNGRIL